MATEDGPRRIPLAYEQRKQKFAAGKGEANEGFESPGVEKNRLERDGGIWIGGPRRG